MARQREELKPRLLRSFVERGDCWIWTGSSTKDGYGVLTIGRKQHRAHRVAYQEFVGDIPAGNVVCHRCDTPLCIRPEHLFIGSPKDNTQDMLAKGRRPRIAGLDHPNTKISPAERENIKALRARGVLLKEIANQYGVSFQLISDICIGRRNYATGY